MSQNASLAEPLDQLDRPPRILFLSSDKYPPFRVDVDVLFGKEMHQRGYHIDWLMQRDDQAAAFDQQLDDVNETSWRGWRVFLGQTDTGGSMLNRLHKHWLNFRNDLRVFKLARTTRYDFIQVKDKFLGALLALWAAKRAGCGFVFWLSWPFPEASLHAARIGTARYPMLYRLRGTFFGIVLYRIIAPRALHIFVQSEQMKIDMTAKGVDPYRMTAVPMGFEPLPEDNRDVQANVHEILYLGTLLKTRRLEFLVQVLEEVRKQVPDATLTLVGPEELPGDAAVIEAEAESLGLSDAINLTGRMPREEAFERVRQAAVCVSPFYPTPILNSTSPTKLIEYFALKKATVANDHPEQRQVLEDSGGGICTPYDHEAFALAVVKLLKDPERAAEMGAAGYDYVMQHRTYAAIGERLDAAYRKLGPVKTS